MTIESSRVLSGACGKSLLVLAVEAAAVEADVVIQIICYFDFAVRGAGSS